MPTTTKYASLPAAFKKSGKTVDGFNLYEQSDLFKIGDYPDKSFSLTAEEAQKAVQAFKPQPVNLEHAPAMLVGKLGEVRNIWLDGDWVKGEVAIPTWLDDQLTDDERQLSAEWTIEGKEFVGLALTPTPHITEARLVSAFTASGKTEVPVPAPRKEGDIPERKPRMNWKTFSDGFRALFTQAGIKFEDGEQPLVIPVIPPQNTPEPPKVEETAEFKALKAENERLQQFAKQPIIAKRAEAESAAVTAHGQNTADFTQAKAMIDATDNLVVLDGLIATFKKLKPVEGNDGNRRTFSTKQTEQDVDNIPEDKLLAVACGKDAVGRAVFARIKERKVQEARN